MACRLTLRDPRDRNSTLYLGSSFFRAVRDLAGDVSSASMRLSNSDPDVSRTVAILTIVRKEGLFLPRSSRPM